MTRAEIEAAGDALTEWFKSQDIKPSDAFSVMAYMMTQQVLGAACASDNLDVFLAKMLTFSDLIKTKVKYEVSLQTRAVLEKAGVNIEELIEKGGRP